MPRDSRKSAAYRPFLKCIDPKGIVDGTIRRSKSDLHKLDHKIEGFHRNPKNFSTSSSYKEVSEEIGSGGIRGKLHDPSSFQPLDVSRGAEKLDDAIDSLSKDLCFDPGTKDIAKDLLRGALDLKESLIMLGELQKASQYMPKFKKQKKKSEKETVDDEGIEGQRPIQFRDSHDQMGFQRPRLSADGCSRNSHEELRKVIRDGIARRNQDTDTEDEDYFAPRKLDLASDLATTSSGRFSTVCSDDYSSTDYSLSSTAHTPQKKATGPNVIARLMGLEDMPSNPSRTALQKQLEAETTEPSNPSRTALQKQLEAETTEDWRRPIFEVDMPRVRKHKLVDKKVEPERQTMMDVPETVQSKGLLKSSYVRGLKFEPHHSKPSYSKQGLMDDVPPIVIMKPMNIGRPESSEVYTQTAIGEGEYLAAQRVLRKLKLEKGFPAKAADSRGEGLNFKTKHYRVGSEETPIRRFGQEEETEECKEVIVTSEVKKLKPRERASDKTRTSAPISLEPEKKEAIDQKSSKVQHVAPFSRTKSMQEYLRPKIVPKTQDHAYAVSIKLWKPESEFAKTNNQPYRRQNTAAYTIPINTTKTVLHNIAYQKKDEAEEQKAMRGEKLEFKDATRRIDLPCKTDPNLITTCTTGTDQLPAKVPKYAFEIQIDECSDGVTAPSIQHEKEIKPAEEATHIVSHSAVVKRKCSSARSSMKALLFSSPSFLNHAEELFDLNMNQLISLQAYEIKEYAPRLSLDCSNEILVRKSQRVHPLLQTYARKALRGPISLDRLVEEVCDGLEDLRSYNKLADENLRLSSFYSVLERDIRSEGVASGSMWDFGWMNEFSPDDIELVVVDIDKLILSNLIEELLKDSLP